MALIGIKGFNGMKPISNPLRLEQGDAQLAKNVKLVSGAIAALRGTTTLKSTTSANPQTIFRYGTSATETNYWLEFPGDVDVVRSPIAQDQYDRLYWTDGGDPKYAPNSVILTGASLPGAYYKLGVPKPSAAAAITSSSSVPVYTRVSRSYVMTMYNPTSSKESSATAPVVVQAVDGYTVTLTLPTSNNGDAAVTKKRIYRKVSGTYRLVVELNVDVATYADSATDATLGSAAALASGVESRPAAPTVAPYATAAAVTVTSSAISRQYIYTVKNVSDSGSSAFYQESAGSSAVTISADDTQTVTISGMSATGTIPYAATVFRVYRKDATDSVYRLVGETTTTSFADVIANNPSPTLLQTYSPDAPNSVKPTTTPTAAANSSSATTAVKRMYAVTYMDAAGNESTPSPASNTVDVVNGVTSVTVRHLDSAPSGVTKRRLYRQTVTVSSGALVTSDANYKLVAENTANTNTFSDAIADASLGATLSVSLQGLPAPASAAISASAQIPASTVPETRTYVYTLVSAYGEEGPPSDASTVATLDPTQSVTVSLPAGAPAGAYNITLKRIYRSSTVGNQAQFQYVAEVPVATSSYVDTKAQADLGEILLTEHWYPPPTGMKGLKMMANGVAVGFVGNTVWFSEPNLPHAWPHSYTLDYEIVGLATYGQTVVALTKAFPYLLQGVDPAAMARTKMELPQSCVSKRSIVETGDGVIYASPDGLVSIGSNGIGVATQSVMSRDQWQAYKPESIIAYLYNGRWHGFYTDANNARGLIILDMTGQGAYMTVSDVNSSSAVTAGFQDASTDTLYLAQGGSIVRFDRGTAFTYLWRSKIFRMPHHVNFSVGQVRSSGTPVTMRVYADGVLRHTQTVTSSTHFRLPSGFKALDWYFELEGDQEITEAFLATSVAELMAV